MQNTNNMRQNTPQNIETGEWGNPIPIAEEEMMGMQCPCIHNNHHRILPPDPLVMKNPIMIEHSILEHSSILPETLTDQIFTPSFLASQIGKMMKVEFLVNTHMIEKSGELIAVGASYILLRTPETGEVIMGDLFAVKFATIYNP